MRNGTLSVIGLVGEMPSTRFSVTTAYSEDSVRGPAELLQSNIESLLIFLCNLSLSSSTVADPNLSSFDYSR